MTEIRQRTDRAKEEFIAFANDSDFYRLIGMEIVDIDAGWSKTRIAWREDLSQSLGMVHGGVIATLIDSGIAYAILMTEAAAQAGSFVALDLRVKYFRPVPAGVIECESTIPQLGTRLVHGQSVVTNEKGKEVARGDAIYMMTPRRGAFLNR